MSEPRLTDLLDRAVHEAPPMHLDTGALLAAGQGRVRRRRATGAGAVAGALALSAAVWGGLAGGGDLLTGPPEIQPATTVWEPGESVDVALFSGYSTIDAEQVGHSFDARLVRPVVDGPVVLELADQGIVVERVPAQTPVPGLEVFAGERMTVALWAEPEGVVSSVPLVGPVDPGGPAGRQQGPEISGERTAYAVWPADVAGLTVPDSVRDVYLIGRDDVVALSGAAVESAVLEAGDARAVAWSDSSSGVWGYDLQGQTSTALHQLGRQPAQTAASVFMEGDVSFGLHVLPEEASVLPAQDPRTRLDSAVLGGRPLVLAATSGEDIPEVSFRLGEGEYTVEAYQDDLLTLELGSERLSPVEPPQQPGTLELLASSGEHSLLTVGAEDLEQGLATLTVDGRPLVVTAGWDPGADVLRSARVELDDGSGPRWVSAQDVAQTVLADGRVVTVLAVDLAGDDQVLAVGRQEGGQVERWDPPVVAAGVEWSQVDGALVPLVHGEPLPRVDDGSVAGVRHYRAAQGSATGYVVLPGVGAAGTTLVPLVAGGDGALQTAAEIVHQVDEVETAAGVDTVLHVVGGLGTDGGSSIVAVAVQGAQEGAANTWYVVGDTTSAHMILDPGLVVSIGGDQEVWIVYPTGSVDPAELRAGRIGEDVLTVSTGAGTILVAVHPEGQEPPRVGVDEGRLEPVTTEAFPGRGLVAHVWTLTPAG